MGEIADMMLDGSLCEQCGEFLGDGEGYPTLCAACKREALEHAAQYRADWFGPQSDDDL